MFEIEIQNFGDIVIKEKQKEVLIVKRNCNFYGKIVSEYFAENNLILKTTSIKSIFWKLQIDILTPKFDIKQIGKYNFYNTKFNCNKNEIEIIDNPFYFFSKKMSIIKFNKKIIATANLKNSFGINKKGNLSIFVHFLDLDKKVQFENLLCFAISCNLLNAG